MRTSTTHRTRSLGLLCGVTTMLLATVLALAPIATQDADAIIFPSDGEPQSPYLGWNDRDYTLQPFNSHSFWNLPVHRDAHLLGYYQPAGLTAAANTSYAADVILLDPDMVVPVGGGVAEVIWPDGQGSNEEVCVRQAIAALNDADAGGGLAVREITAEACSGTHGVAVGSNGTAGELPIDARGDGRTGTIAGGGLGLAGIPSGSHGGSGLPAIGGVIRRGEFESGIIRHALKVSLPADEIAERFVWPAHGIDVDASCDNGAAGAPAIIAMGAQLALLPNFDVGRLESDAGKIVAVAMRDYGAYVADATAPTCGGVGDRSLHVETGPTTDGPTADVAAEFLDLYGYDMDTAVAGFDTPFARDMDLIWAELQVLGHSCHDDMAPLAGACAGFIGGGATDDPASTRMAPIAPEGPDAPPGLPYEKCWSVHDDPTNLLGFVCELIHPLR